MKKLSKTEKKIRMRLGKRIKRLEDKLVPPIPWLRRLNVFLADIIRKAKSYGKKRG